MWRCSICSVDRSILCRTCMWSRTWSPTCLSSTNSTAPLSRGYRKPRRRIMEKNKICKVSRLVELPPLLFIVVRSAIEVDTTVNASIHDWWGPFMCASADSPIGGEFAVIGRLFFSGSCEVGWVVWMHPVCLLLYFVSLVLVEPRQISGARCPYAGLQVRLKPVIHMCSNILSGHLSEGEARADGRPCS